MHHSPSILAVFLAVAVVGCSSSRAAHEQTAAPPSDFSADAVRAEALRDASAAISNGELHICETGTIGIYAPGVPKRKLELVRGLPRRTLPSGCTEPRVFRSIAYAEVFNGEIVKYLSKHKR
jgi:hypothetical protein